MFLVHLNVFVILRALVSVFFLLLSVSGVGSVLDFSCRLFSTPEPKAHF